MNRLYEKICGYREVFQDQRYYSFEECKFPWGQLGPEGQKSTLNTGMASMNHLIKHLFIDCGVRIYYLRGMVKEACGMWGEWKIIWNRGKLFDEGMDKELMYFHFRTRKREKEFLIGRYDRSYGSFSITKNGIFYKNRVTGFKRLIMSSKKTLINEIEHAMGEIGRYVMSKHPRVYLELKKVLK